MRNISGDTYGFDGDIAESEYKKSGAVRVLGETKGKK